LAGEDENTVLTRCLLSILRKYLLPRWRLKEAPRPDNTSVGVGSMVVMMNSKGRVPLLHNIVALDFKRFKEGFVNK
jgi:hypothetical protein